MATQPDKTPSTDGLPRDGRKLWHTMSFTDALACVDKRVAAASDLCLVPGRSHSSPQPQPQGTYDKVGRDEAGLAHERGQLRRVAPFNTIFDNFSKAAEVQPVGELPIAIEIGSKLRAARLAQGLTQSTVAAQTGILQSTISDIEKGKGPNGPNCSTVKKMYPFTPG